MKSNKPRMHETPAWVKEVLAPSIIEGLVEMDRMGNSICDMYLVSCEPYKDIPGHVKLTIIGWENEKTRDTFPV